MSPDLTTQAVTAALSNNWQEAIKLNLTLLKENPENVEALNRLARAYKENGEIKLAQKTYRKVLTLDRFNPIAQKNLKLLESSPRLFRKPGDGHQNLATHCPPEMFLEEPGKTKVVNLINLAPGSILLPLCCGDQTSLTIKRRTVTVVDGNGTYLGALPDDLSTKLIRRLLSGNRYDVYVKTVSKNCLSVIIKETFRAPRFKNQPTFPCLGSDGSFYGKGDAFTEDEEQENLEETESEEDSSTIS